MTEVVIVVVEYTLLIIVCGRLTGDIGRATANQSDGQSAARITARVHVKLPLRHRAPIQVTPLTTPRDISSAEQVCDDLLFISIVP